MSLLGKEKKKGSSTVFGSNPVLRRLNKLKEAESYSAAEGCATYTGIFKKTGMFLLITVIGVVLYAVLNQLFFQNGSIALVLNKESDDIKTIYFSMPELIIGGAAAIFTFIMPFVCAFSIGATPVCGSIYCLSEGYLLSFLLFKLLKLTTVDPSIGLLALVLTILVVATMAFLYTKRIVKVNEKFRAVLFTVAGAVIIGGLICLVLSFIPATRSFIGGLTSNPVISIGISILSIVLASMFLLSDFAVVENCVTSAMPKEYEWMASFGLAFTVIWLYMKILELLIKLTNNKD